MDMLRWLWWGSVEDLLEVISPHFAEKGNLTSNWDSLNALSQYLDISNNRLISALVPEDLSQRSHHLLQTNRTPWKEALAFHSFCGFLFFPCNSLQILGSLYRSMLHILADYCIAIIRTCGHHAKAWAHIRIKQLVK